eukprot:9025172-Lingulodinium_polyedra.AAC.1
MTIGAGAPLKNRSLRPLDRSILVFVVFVGDAVVGAMLSNARNAASVVVNSGILCSAVFGSP